MIARNKTKRRAFTLIELLVAIAILGILVAIALLAYNKFTKSAECGSNKEQHRKVVNLAKETYAFCRLNGFTYMNSAPGSGCRSQASSGMTAISGGGSVKCIRKWDCKSDWAGRTQNAGLSSGWFFEHVRAEFNQPRHTGGFARNDQWQNFLKPNYPSRTGITNIRDKGVNMHIATYLGPGCDGNFSNSAGSYLVDEIVWP